MSLHPDFPVVEGRYRLTREWELDLPEPFNRRMEDGDMVLWRPGLTFWIAIWSKEEAETPEDTLAWIVEDASPDRTDEKLDDTGDVIRHTYRLQEEDPERTPATFTSINGHVIAVSDYVQITAYTDDADAGRTAEQVIGSVRRYAAVQ